MPTVTVKNIPNDLYVSLKRSAQPSRRGLNSEIIVCIESPLRVRRVEPDLVLAKARRLHEKTREGGRVRGSVVGCLAAGSAERMLGV